MHEAALFAYFCRPRRPGFGECIVQHHFQTICSGAGLIEEASVNEFG